MAVTTEAKDLADVILAQLGEDFNIPAVDLTGVEYDIPSDVASIFSDTNAPSLLDVNALTDGTVGGEGAFDKIMSSHKAHIKEQYELGLITGDQYTKAYIELTTAALSSGVQMVLGRDATYWQAQLVRLQGRKAEIEAVTARVQLGIAKAQLAAANRQAQMVNAQYVLTLMQTSVEDAKYRLIHDQMDMIKEQTEAQRGQTLDTRSDGVTPITGSVGKQKELYDQQIDSYLKDAKQKVAKLYMDAWTVQRTTDEAFTPPNQFTNTEIEAVLLSLRTTNNLT